MICITEANDRNLYSLFGGIMNVIPSKAVLQISYKDSLHGPSGLAWVKELSVTVAPCRGGVHD